jgi:hypothetical protein
MSIAGRRPGTRALAAVLGVANLFLVARPDAVLSAASVRPPRPPRWVVRLLGARTVLQEVAVITVPTRRLVLGGAVVDGLHAASMGLALAVWPQHRRAAAISAVAATASAVLELATAPTAPRGLRPGSLPG